VVRPSADLEADCNMASADVGRIDRPDDRVAGACIGGPNRPSWSCLKSVPRVRGYRTRRNLVARRAAASKFTVKSSFAIVSIWLSVSGQISAYRGRR
jgi:hypothetical protein